MEVKDPVAPKGESRESVQTDENETMAREHCHSMRAKKWARCHLLSSDVYQTQCTPQDKWPLCNIRGHCRQPHPIERIE